MLDDDAGLTRVSGPRDIPRSEGAPTANVDPALVLPRNLSHEDSSFNLRHYFPKQALAKARQRRKLQQQGTLRCKCGCSLVAGRCVVASSTKDAEGSVNFGLYEEQTPAGNNNNTAMSGHPSSACDPGAELASAKETAEKSAENSTEDALTNPNCDLLCLSDTDTNYSEDYTRMTEVGDGSETGGRTPLGSFTSDDLDSPSVGSDGGWSSSTLSEAGAVDALSPDSPTKAKANIKLLLGHPPLNDDDDDNEVECATSPVDEEPPEGSEGMTPSDSNATLFEDREFDFLKAEPVRRSTSLKTYKTPPGTPHKKKAVRFADALGLDLESVRHILNLEDPPTVPKSAMKDLRVGLEEEHRTEGTKYLAAYFPQPSNDPSFFTRVREDKVVLENCLVDDKDMTVSGTARVANIAFHKKVIVRYTINNWLTFEDVCASYVQNSTDGPTDRFSFTINVPHYFSVGSRLAFALMYTTNGCTYWDNNRGTNYIVECYAKAVPTHPSDSSWIHFL